MKNNNKIYTILFIFITISLFLIVFFIVPLFKEIKKNSEDMISAKGDIYNLERQIIEINNFEKKYEEYKINLEKIDGLFVDPNNPVDFIKFLENTSYESNLVSKIVLFPSTDPKQFIIFQIVSKGNFLDLLNFTKKIENGLYLVEIENLNIKNQKQELEKTKSEINKNYSLENFEANFTIKVFIKQY